MSAPNGTQSESAPLCHVTGCCRCRPGCVCCWCGSAPALSPEVCSHPITVDLAGEAGVRLCLTCGASYERGPLLQRLRLAIRERHALPPSPWSSAERSQDCDL